MTQGQPKARPEAAGSLYRTVWRWHFYAGLFVLPFILILSITGSIYLLKLQIDRWEERLQPAGLLSTHLKPFWPGRVRPHTRHPDHATSLRTSRS